MLTDEIVAGRAPTSTRMSAADRASKGGRASRNANHKRGCGHPTTAEIVYTANEWEFMQAIEAFKRTSGRQFPTWREVYRVIESLGYSRGSGKASGGSTND